jgi:hypothetical protein
MSKLWEVANAVEEVSYKLENLRQVVCIIAEHNEESGALWSVTDSMKTMVGTLEKEANLILAHLREVAIEANKKPTKKGKKDA